MNVLTIGLTGGLGSGKTVVAELFADKGVSVFDADVISRELVEPGQPALADIVTEFGSSILLEGRLNRSALRDRIYANPRARRRLEAILHPRVYQTLVEKAGQLHDPYCLFAIPLLIETGQQSFVDRILLVDCPVELQYERARLRDGLDDQTISLILDAQASRAERVASAHDIIDNSGSIARLREQVEKLHEDYLALALHRV